MVPGSVVLPVYAKCGKGAGCLKLGKKVFIRFEMHAVDIAFAVTFYKLQGLTLDKVILDINQPPSGLFALSFNSAYVGFTRVRKASDMRIMPVNSKGLQHMSNLRPDAQLRLWRSGFDDNNGEWTPPPQPHRAPTTVTRRTTRPPRSTARNRARPPPPATTNAARPSSHVYPL